MEVTFIGQSTLLIEISGLSILTDPWWGTYEFMRGAPAALDPGTLERLDLMLVSHNHIDHFCRPAVRLARSLGATVVGSKRAAKRAERGGVGDVAALEPGDRWSTGGLTVTAVPADHPFAADAVGFVVEAEKTFYFSGDTRFDRVLVEALLGFDLDVAMLQVACSTYPLVGKDGMDLEAAALLASTVRPRLAIPIHYQVKGKVLQERELRAWDPGVPALVLEPGVPASV